MNSDAQVASVDNLFGSEPAEQPAPAQEAAPEPAYQPIENFNDAPPQESQNAPAPVAPAPELSQQPQQHQVPLAHLIEERKRAQSAERERSQLLEAVARLTAQQQQQTPQPVYERPDPIADPEGAYAALENKVQQGFLNQHLNMSERYARTQHGTELVDQALDAAQRAGYDSMFVNRPDPYGEMVNWYRGQQVAQEIGTDPAAYRAKIESDVTARVRAEIMAQLQAGKAPPQNLPPSLSTSTNASGGVEHVPAARDFFNSMMSNRPPNRG